MQDVRVTKPMTLDREDIIWIAIRIFGLFFLARAILLVPDIYGAISWLHYLGPSVQNMGEGTELSIKTTQSHLLDRSLALFLYLAIGLYLLRGGLWVFKLIKLPTKNLNSKNV